jgi:hypothetical protein
LDVDLVLSADEEEVLDPPFEGVEAADCLVVEELLVRGS